MCSGTKVVLQQLQFGCRFSISVENIRGDMDCRGGTSNNFEYLQIEQG